MTTVVDIDSPTGERFKLGLIHEPHASAPDLLTFATEPIPTPPANVPLIEADYPMALNNNKGDCTIAGAVHVNELGDLVAGEPWTYCGDALVDKTYTGLTGGPDTGLMLPQVLKPWHRGEFLGQKPNGGYGSIHSKNTKLLKTGIWVFGNAYCAVNLPAIAQTQFKSDGSGVWELTGTSEDYNIEGGHCIVGAAYTSEGVYMLTWGEWVLATWEWWFTYGVQAYSVVPPGFVARGGDARGFSVAQLDGWLDKA